MSSVEQITEPLIAGEKLSRDEFLRRWEALPNLKRAELIEGVVYLPSPVSLGHCDHDHSVNFWLGYYCLHTPGCKAGPNATWLMLGDAPQPDVHLRILPEYGGQSGVEGGLASGAPELIVEVSHSTVSRDFGPKLRLYRSAGVREYINVLPQNVIWRRFTAGSETLIDADSEGILRSVDLPGLWLDAAALLQGDTRRVVEVLERGLASPEHAGFVSKLAAFNRAALQKYGTKVI